MNFFEQQDKTQSRSKLLVLLFLLAVIAIIFAVYFPIQYIGLGYYGEQKLHRQIIKDNPIIWNYDIFLKVTLGTLAVIIIGSFMKIRELSEGGCAVAHMMGGQLVEPTTTDFKERQLINVVEEMAIAAGIPAPNIYILDHENTINAFAAGFTIGDAVIGVTRGTVEKLSREELQGVIAHEFSHIMHGDMRLNIKLIGLLHGILAISLIGRVVMRGSSKSSNRKNGGGLILVGLALFIIGWIGYLFGKLIQSAVSRQREFLADATAVQYTRNLDGISGALKKIAGYLKIPATGSYLSSSNRDQISHMTFGSVGLHEGSGWMSTHPRIEDRIKALDPQFHPEQYEKMQPVFEINMPGTTSTSSFQTPRKMMVGDTEMKVSPKIQYTAENMSSLIGKIPAQAIAAQSAWLSEMDEDVYAACHHIQKARAVLYILLTEFNEKIKPDFEKLLNLRDPHILDAFRSLWAPLKKIGLQGRLRLIDLCIPALRSLPKEDYKIFIQTLAQLIRLDGQMSLFEFLMMKTIKRHLKHFFNPKKTTPISIQKISSVQQEIIFLLSSIAQCEKQDDLAFQSATTTLFLDAKMIPSPTCDIEALDLCLKKLLQTSFDIRKNVMEACAKVVLFDRDVTWKEREMLRLIGDSLDCPLPHLQ